MIIKLKYQEVCGILYKWVYYMSLEAGSVDWVYKAVRDFIKEKNQGINWGGLRRGDTNASPWLGLTPKKVCNHLIPNSGT